jgi:hypothetical protein
MLSLNCAQLVLSAQFSSILRAEATSFSLSLFQLHYHRFAPDHF